MTLRSLALIGCVASSGAVAQQSCFEIAGTLHPNDDMAQMDYCLDQMQAQVDNLQGQIERITNTFRGAIVAFNRSEEEVACPAGWSLFRDAGGRVIVGAGQHQNPGVNTEYPSFADDPSGATGGFEQVTLSASQMPSHDHGRALVLSTDVLYGMNNGYRYHNSGAPTVLPAEGGGQPHENRPPYIALYFCQLD